MGTLTAQNETDILSPREGELSAAPGFPGRSDQGSDFGKSDRPHSFFSLVHVSYLGILRFNSMGWVRCDVSPLYLTYDDVRIMYGEMDQVSPSCKGESVGRRLCLPYAVSHLFPYLEEARQLLRYGTGPYTMHQFGNDVPIRFSFYGEEEVREGKYILLVETGGGEHCVGLSESGEGVCTWYDSEWDFVMSCPVAILPHPESLDLVLLACTEKGVLTSHSHPRSRTHIGGRRRISNMRDAVSQPSSDTPREAGSIDSSMSGEEEEDGHPATEGERRYPAR